MKLFIIGFLIGLIGGLLIGAVLASDKWTTGGQNGKIDC